MALNELQAQRVLLVRAIEQARDNGGAWSAADAREATRATTELVGAKAGFDQFVARRAEWVLEEVRRRRANAAVDVGAPRWPRTAAVALIVAALLTGLVTDYLAAEHRVDLVEYPLIGLILWNVVVCLLVVVRSSLRLLSRRKTAHGGFLLETIGKLRLRGALSLHSARGNSWVGQFRNEWSALSAPLNEARLALALHLAAISFALGVMISLCFRGLYKGYLACWETSFLEVTANTVHNIVSVVLAPGAVLLDRTIPDAQHIAGLHCVTGKGELAGPWILLYAASILLWIVLPRLLLATAARVSIWRLQRFFPLSTKSSYFTTLKAIRYGDALDVLLVPFRYELSANAKDNLTRLLERVFGLTVTISVQQPVLMGADTKDWQAALGNERHIAVFVIFNLAATAESDAHGELLQRIRYRVDGRIPVVPLVDTSNYVERDPDRFRERCNQWRTVLDAIGLKPLFINLASADDEAVLQDLGARLNAHG